MEIIDFLLKCNFAYFLQSSKIREQGKPIIFIDSREINGTQVGYNLFMSYLKEFDIDSKLTH